MKTFNINLKNAAMFVVSLAICLAIFTGCQKEESKSNNGPTKSNEKQITSFKFIDPPVSGTINELEKTITVNVAKGTTVVALVPTITISEKATVTPASGIAQNFTNPVVYTVTAENGTTASYTVKVNILDDRDEWVGQYITTCNYTIEGESTSYQYILYVEKSETTLNGIYFKDFLKNCKDLPVTGLKVYAEVNGNDFTIHPQTHQGFEFSGSGKRDNLTININNTATPQWGTPVSFTQVAKKD